MRTVLVGAVQSSDALLSAAIDASFDIRAVMTLAPDPGSSVHSDYCDLMPRCQSHDIPCRYMNAPEDLDVMLDEFNADLLLVWGWSRLIKSATYKNLQYGAVGFHPSPLPKGRGRHPLIWTILLGLRQSAVTFFVITEEADAGEILVQRAFDLPRDVDARHLMELVISEGCKAVPSLLNQLQTKGIRGCLQNEEEAVVWRKRSETDGRIDFRMNALAVDRLVRALNTPYPGATATHVTAGTARVWQTRIVPRPARSEFIEPGRIVDVIDEIPIIACGEAAIMLLSHEFQSPLTKGSWFC
jgi:methionyl-tRNA formyltransferase